jgi:hypothetical protein
MEDVLDLHAEPYDAQRPVVNFDESSKQLIEETRVPLPAQPATEDKPGVARRYDTEYKRNGTCNLFMFCEPHAGWRHIEVTQRRTLQDFAHQMQWLVDEAYPDADVIRIVLDNLNTHRPAALYETFPPAEARRILKKIEFHYTPKHGSWLNMAEIEFSILNRQCLNRRIGNEATLRRCVRAYENQRNLDRAEIHWTFTTAKARVKLKRLYPSLTG